MAKNANKNFSLPTIKDLEIYFDLIKKKDISELEIETDQIRIKIVSENKNIKFSSQQTASEIINHSQSAELNNQNNKGTFEVKTEGEVIKSPMVGTAYLSPDPESPPFVKVGDTVSEGNTLVLIEAMKVYNPIKAARSGIVKRVFINNGTPIEFGEPLMIIE